MELTNNVLAGRYQIVKYLSQGGMGAVYLGHDTLTNMPVAIKHLKPDVVEADPTILTRFDREGDALAALNHPNIVKMLDTLQENGQHFLIMEYVGGGSLTDLLAKQPKLPVSRVVQIALDLADALTRSHRLKIIHRDIKPANVLLAEDGTPRLTDFGVAHIGDSTISGDGSVVGTYAYLSPEALIGTPLDARADIWAFGVMMFEMLAGRRPFEDANHGSLITAILNKPIPDLEVLRPDAPVALVDLIYRMLVKDREQRINSVRLVGAELEAILQVGTFTPPPSTPHTAATDEGKTALGFTPTPSKPQQAPNNLPLQTTPFVGRAAELAELLRTIQTPGVRLLTVLSPGGMGKTRLALEAAAAQLEQFEDGVFYTALAPLNAPDQVLTATAQAIRFSFQPNMPQQEQLLNYLHEKKMLLIFDNLEHLPITSSLISEILNHAPDVKIVATSRERLNLQAENLFRLGGMDYPDRDTADMQALEQFGTVQLFVQSARRVRPDFALTQENHKDVLRIIRLMQGMPLGIVLAAAWAEMLSVGEIAEEIENNVDFLESEQGDLPERQRSLRAVFEYSWDLLSEAERETFKKLSVFRGHFTREAAQNIVNASLKTLMGLVNKSLLHRDPTLGLYQVDQMLRQYAEVQLSDADRQVLRDAHRSYYLALIHKQVPKLQGRDQVQALRAIQQEEANVIAAWEWAIAQRQVDAITEAFESMIIYHITLFTPFAMQRHLTEMITMLSEFPHEGKHGIAYGMALALRVGLQSIFGGEPTPEQRRQVEEARALLTKLKARRELAIISNVTVFVVSFEEAGTALMEAVATMRELGERWWLAQILMTLAQGTLRAPGMLELAKSSATEAHQIAHDLGDMILDSSILLVLSEISYTEQDLAKAKAYLDEWFATDLPIRTLADRVSANTAYGIMSSAMGADDEAWRSLQEALEGARELGVGFITGEVLTAMARLALHQGHADQALLLMQEAEQIKHPYLDFRRATGQLWTLLGRVYLALGNLPHAQEYLTKGLQKNIDYGLQVEAMESLCGLAHLIGLSGRPAEAVAMLSYAQAQAGNAMLLADVLPPLLDHWRIQLSTAEFESALAQGKTMTQEQVQALLQ